MKYINTFTDGMHVSGVYLCRQKNIALTRNGKEYCNLVLQDKTGQIEGKIWDLGNPGIRDFEAMEYVHVDGHITVFNGANQFNVQRIQTASEGEYNQSDYFPVSSKDIKAMQVDLKKLIDSVNNPHLSALLKNFFSDAEFVKKFSSHSAAKSIHHGFIGGLLEHSLSVATLCSKTAELYPFVNRDLLITGAILHDIGKIEELSAFPFNDYTDAGQLLGHIMIGAQWVDQKAAGIEGFPKRLRSELVHMILAHHGELEYGSPKKPAIMEALILSFCDNLDAKVETMHEAIETKVPQNEDGWLGYNKLLDSNIRRTGD